MKGSIRVSAKTLDDAITEALIQLGVTSDRLEYNVIEKGSAGFLGIGMKQAVIEAWKKEDKEEEEFLKAVEETIRENPVKEYFVKEDDVKEHQAEEAAKKEEAVRGEIDFTESFTRRVALLKGLDESVMQEIAESLPITEGVDRLMYVLKKYGYKIAILSGGFTYFGQYLQKKYGIDYVYANELEIVDGKLTGRYLGDVVDGKRKAELLRLIAQVEKVDIAQTIAVGDGANDLPMLGIAGLGIAFHAKPKVVANAKQSINTIGLDGVLYFLGFKDSYLNM